MNKIIAFGLVVMVASSHAAGYGEYANNNAALCKQFINSGQLKQDSIFCKPTKEGGQVWVYKVSDGKAAATLAARIVESARNQYGIPEMEVYIYRHSKEEDLKFSVFNRPRPILTLKMEE